jgi:hypothetical protein
VGGGWWVYLAMPVFMAGIGYVTKLLAVRMMFQPLGRRGWGPFSWQGVVPRRAARMAAIATELLTSRLISPRDVIARLDPDAVADQLELPIALAVEEIAREVMEEYRRACGRRCPSPLAPGSCGGCRPRRRTWRGTCCATSGRASTSSST